MVLFFEILFACGVGVWFYTTQKKVKKARVKLNDLESACGQQERKTQDAKLSEQEIRATLNNLNHEYDIVREQLIFERGVLEATKKSNEEKLKILAQEEEEKGRTIIEERRAQTDAKLSEFQDTLDKLRARVKAENESRKMAEKDTAARDFHRICVPLANLKDIERLRQIAPELNSPDILYKLIWKTFYMSETSEMINRVVGTDKISGIYKITYIPTGKCYIGRSIDIAERFKYHIRCALKASKGSAPLYDKMFELGVENFTFEILQKASIDELPELEAYWIDFYDSVNSGFNDINGSH